MGACGRPSMPPSPCVRAGVADMRPLRRPAAGLSLVLALVLTAALALGAAATLQLASGTEKVAQGFRMQALALQAAEAALRHCERQLLLPELQRPPQLQEARIAQMVGTAAWTLPATWRGPDLSPAPPPWGRGLDGVPASSGAVPVCLVEKLALDGGQVHVVTARGFSPDWRGDASQNTLAGSSVWLQSLLLVHNGQVRDRAQRRILHPPLR